MTAADHFSSKYIPIVFLRCKSTYVWCLGAIDNETAILYRLNARAHLRARHKNAKGTDPGAGQSSEPSTLNITLPVFSPKESDRSSTQVSDHHDAYSYELEGIVVKDSMSSQSQGKTDEGTFAV